MGRGTYKRAVWSICDNPLALSYAVMYAEDIRKTAVIYIVQ